MFMGVAESGVSRPHHFSDRSGSRSHQGAKHGAMADPKDTKRIAGLPWIDGLLMLFILDRITSKDIGLDRSSLVILFIILLWFSQSFSMLEFYLIN
jgi:hypothetical protein